MKERLRIPVRALVEWVLRSGDLGSGQSGPVNSVDAIRIHKKIQRSRQGRYAPEVPIRLETETERFIVELSGRIDGILTDPDRVVIEEIKTTTRPLDGFDHFESGPHWGQVQLYAYMYAVQNDLLEVDVQLTYYHIGSGQTREYVRTRGLDELTVFFRDILNRYLGWMEKVVDRITRRNRSLTELQFPFSTFRPGQREMAVRVYLAIKNGTRLLVQAPTGIGKTMAALFPGLKALAEGLTPRLFYLTARTTGGVAAEKAIRTLCSAGEGLKWVRLTAKEKMCLNPESDCNGESCFLAKGYYDRLPEALDSIFTEDDFSRERILSLAERSRLCPFELSLDLALWVDVIICDYNYAFDPRVHLRRFFQDGSGDHTFLVDEAHNLVERAREMFSAHVSRDNFQSALESPAIPEEIKNKAKEIVDWMSHSLDDSPRSRPNRTFDRPPTAPVDALNEFCDICEPYLASGQDQANRQTVLDLYFETIRFTRAAEDFDDNCAVYVERSETDIILKIYCLDPSSRLKTALKRARASVFFSATLMPAAYFQHLLGCDNETGGGLALPSPFPPENLCLMISDRVSTRYRERDRSIPLVTSLIARSVRSLSGRFLVFFPSYQYMTQVHAAFSDEAPDIHTLVQTPGMAEVERLAFLDRFDRRQEDTLVGFAVLGGVFGEGIDLRGDRLHGAIIVGPGLPAICFERELLKSHFQKKYGRGFEYAYQFPGFIRVLQAAGRVIRSESDRGLVLLIDQRFGNPGYRSLMPRHWQPCFISDLGELKGKIADFMDSFQVRRRL